MTIVTLTGDNGLLIKVGESKEENIEAEICEQIKLAYLEYNAEKYNNSAVDDVEFLTNSLKQKLKDENLTIKVKNGKYTIKMQEDNIYKYNSKTGNAYKYEDVINYYGKTRKTLAVGDNISIGTEKFMILSKTNTEVKAMPYYNLKLDETPIKQAVEDTANSAGNISFSTSLYWGINEDKIDMNNNSNNIQPYIEDYRVTLERLVKDDIEVSVARFSELLENGVQDLNRNPGQKGYYWVGSSKNDDANNIRIIIQSGNISGFGPYSNSNTAGVRPIIIIPIE